MGWKDYCRDRNGSDVCEEPCIGCMAKSFDMASATEEASAEPDMRPIEIRPFPNGGFVVSRPNGYGTMPDDIGAYSSAEHMIEALAEMLVPGFASLSLFCMATSKPAGATRAEQIMAEQPHYPFQKPEYGSGATTTRAGHRTTIRDAEDGA